MPREKQLSFPVTEEEHTRLKSAASERKLTIKAALLAAAELLFAQTPRIGERRYRVRLPICIGDRILQPGETVNLPTGTAEQYRHALSDAVDEREIIEKEGAPDSATPHRIRQDEATFICRKDNVDWHSKLEKILILGSERNRVGIEENLDWAVGNLTRALSRPKGRAAKQNH